MTLPLLWAAAPRLPCTRDGLERFANGRLLATPTRSVSEDLADASGWCRHGNRANRLKVPAAATEVPTTAEVAAAPAEITTAAAVPTAAVEITTPEAAPATTVAEVPATAAGVVVAEVAAAAGVIPFGGRYVRHPPP